MNFNDFLRYDKETGNLRWERRPSSMFNKQWQCDSWNTKYAGKKIITLDGKGYLVLSIFGKRYIAHRVVWEMVYGKPPTIIDHINGVRTDNRLCNLREVTCQQNHMNASRPRTNTSGVIGVYLNKKRGIWCAQIKHNGHTRHLGSSPIFEEAVVLRKAEEKRLGFSPTHGRLKK